MKRIFVFLLALVMMLSFCACTSSIEKEAKNALEEHLKNLPAASLNAENALDTTVDFVKYIEEKYQYEINSFEMTNDTTAKATVKISNRNLGESFAAATAEYFVYAFGMAFAENPPSEEEMNKQYETILINYFKNASIVDNTVEFTLTKDNGVWNIVSNEVDTFNAVSGNLYNAIEELAASFTTEE